MNPIHSLLARISARSDAAADTPIFTWYDVDGRDRAALTAADVLARGTAVAARLRADGVEPGERVLLVYPPGLHFVGGLLGCLLGGQIPVPIYPPDPLRVDQRWHELGETCRRFGIRHALTDTRYNRARKLGRLRGALGRWSRPQLSWRATDRLSGGALPDPPPRAVDDVALLQFTSGSTSAPRGVEITWGNLDHQLAMNAEALGYDGDSRLVAWLPQYHDFGLISGILSALWGNGRLWLCSPLDFMRRPAVWLEVASRVKATHTAAPDFGYALVVRKTTPAERAALDLSGLRVAMTAAEPIRPETVTAFRAAFAPAGFDPAALIGAYGLAEHTVGVTIGPVGLHRVDPALMESNGRIVPSADPDARLLVDSGPPVAGIEVRIVDPETHHPMGEGRIGEIWVDSPSRAKGYLEDPEATEATFGARVAGEPDRTWLRTGDLGAMSGGRLFVTGRLKEMIIVRGRNLFPVDVEAIARAAHPAVRPGGVAAVAIDDGSTEALGLVIERRSGDGTAPAEIAEAVRAAVADGCRTAVRALAVVEVGTVPKTTSGKPRRSTLSQWMSGDRWAGPGRPLAFATWREGDAESDGAAWLELQALVDGLDGLPVSARRPALLETLCAAVARLSGGRDPASIVADQPLEALGLGSLTAVALADALGHALRQPVTVEWVQQLGTIEALAAWIETGARSASAETDARPRVRPEPAMGPVSGLCFEGWRVRPAVAADVPALHRLEGEQYGWLGPDAVASPGLIADRIALLNGGAQRWMWVLDGPEGLAGWGVLQPTRVDPDRYRSWAEATDDGRLRGTFDPDGDALYLVAAAVASPAPKALRFLLAMQAVRLMQHAGIETLFTCAAMPGYRDRRAAGPIRPEDYIAETDPRGVPTDPFLALFAGTWPGEHRPFRLLRDGYPPDRFSGGHGVSAVTRITDHDAALATLEARLARRVSSDSLPPSPETANHAAG